MPDIVVYLGNKSYSSWSLRGWLACKLTGLPFREEVHPMDTPEWKPWILARSPSGKVPCVLIDGAPLWESLAIGEHLAELNPQAFWPGAAAARAHARSIAAEMHAGFSEMRKAMWMNVRRTFPGKGRTPGALADIARIEALWDDTRRRFGAGGPFLFGERFGFADAMYAPVVARFRTWQPEISAGSQAYVDAVWNHPFMAQWVKDAMAEPWTLAKYDTPPL
ncbi:MAG: glutathione S-transferase family protein [Rhodospirillales bacterium]|nr:glutathione S-transferase family protein [Rhodospirillales bacterium]